MKVKIEIEEELTDKEIEAIKDLNRWAIGKKDFVDKFDMNFADLVSRGIVQIAFDDIHLTGYGRKIYSHIKNADNLVSKEEE